MLKEESGEGKGEGDRRNMYLILKKKWVRFGEGQCWEKLKGRVGRKVGEVCQAVVLKD